MDITLKETGFLCKIIGLVLLCASCHSTTDSKLNQDSLSIKKRELLKDYALCQCMIYATEGDTLIKNDISIVIYREISNYGDLSVYTSLDSLAKQTAIAIRPSQIADYNNQKPIMMGCIEFYKSQELDSLVKHFKVEKDFDD